VAPRGKINLAWVFLWIKFDKIVKRTPLCARFVASCFLQQREESQTLTDRTQTAVLRACIWIGHLEINVFGVLLLVMPQEVDLVNAELVRHWPFATAHLRFCETNGLPS